MIEKIKTLTIAIIFGVASTSALASGKGINVEAKRTHSAKVGNALIAHLADQLAQYGVENKDVLALITAAKLHIQIGTQEKVLEKQVTKGKVVTTETSQPIIDLSPRGLLERAKQYAGNRQDLIALADDVAASIPRGRVEGPVHFVTTVDAREIDSIPVNLQAHEAASISITGDGKTDLDLSLFDDKGNEVCVSSNLSDVESCSITPAWSGRFSVRIKNLGGTANRYQIVMN